MEQVEQFFAMERERYHIKLRRDSGQEPPWTEDRILQAWRFCHVFREDDKTTIWFRENVRKHLTGLRVVEATLIFRWFNRIETGEIIKDLLLEGWDEDEARRRLRGVKPLVTGAYMIKTVDGLDKLEGALQAIREALPLLPSITKEFGDSLEYATTALTTLNYMGRFMAYEVVTDLRWTPVLNKAQDILTWANPGPGAQRGLGQVVYGDPTRFHASISGIGEMLTHMREIRTMSMDDKFWPTEWPQWEMREVEHGLCEYMKMCQARAGFRLKRRFQ